MRTVQNKDRTIRRYIFDLIRAGDRGPPQCKCTDSGLRLHECNTLSRRLRLDHPFVILVAFLLSDLPAVVLPLPVAQCRLMDACGFGSSCRYIPQIWVPEHGGRASLTSGFFAYYNQPCQSTCGCLISLARVGAALLKAYKCSIISQWEG